MGTLTCWKLNNTKPYLSGEFSQMKMLVEKSSESILSISKMENRRESNEETILAAFHQCEIVKSIPPVSHSSFRLVISLKSLPKRLPSSFFMKTTK